jgi:predicted transglutaminase-like cysteine proteinase
MRRTFRRSLWLAAVLLLPLLAQRAEAESDAQPRREASAPAGEVAPASGGERHGYPRLFNTKETRSANIRPFPRWTDMLDRHRAEERRGDAPCTPSRFQRCGIGEWLAFLAKERGKDRRTQLADVNSFINQHPYVLDKLNYWETPREFALHDGDCKDYAIAKYFSLRYLGWHEDELRVVVVQDLNLRVAHAVTAVYFGDEILILDNQARQVVRAESIRHYLPYYSINESYWWLHKPG